MSTLRPTFYPGLTRIWCRPGGPWTAGTLKDLMPTGRHLAVVDGPGRVDGSQLDAVVRDLAALLVAAGASRNRAVAWQIQNSLSSLALFWACWRIGLIAAPLHPRLGSAEVFAALEQIDPAVVMASPDLPASGSDGAVVISGSAGTNGLENLLGALEANARRALRPSNFRAVEVRGSDLAVVLFTSGSSGVPKGVLHTHRALAYKGTVMARVHGLRRGDPVLAPAPLAHVSGLLNGVLMSAVLRSPCVLISPWDPEVALQLLESESISFVGAPPVFFSQMAALAAFSRYRVGHLRLISTGGTSVSPALVESMKEAYGCTVKRSYGSTEAPTITTSGPDDPFDRARDTDGHAIGASQVEVRDPLTSSRLGPETEGELWLRGPELFAGYTDPNKTKAAVANPGGWYRSGDLGTLDPDGWLRVTGRLSDIIIRSGENISASEVEAVLEAHPDIRCAAAVPVPDPQVGERVAAFVVSQARFTLEDCRRWFVDRGVTRFKTPELVIQIDALPYLVTGKPDRATLKTIAEQARKQSEE